MSAPETTTAPIVSSVEAPVVAEPVAPRVEESTPVVATEEPAAPVTESEVPTETTAAAEAPAAETTVDEPVAAATTTTEEAAPVEPAKAIESGVLGYKAPGLIKSFKFSKKHFWLGEEPVSSDKLVNYLRGEKPEIAHSTAAWSSQTGKGLLYYAKHAEEKATPAGVLNLAEASDLEKQAQHEFSFKLHGHKHAFKANDDAERDGWYVAIEKAIADAKVAKEGIVGSEGYKEQVAHLSKPAIVAGGAAAGVAGARKSTDVPKAEEPARAGSTSSSDEDAAAKAKSRSASRGKRSSIFGSLLNKKEDHETKKEIKKEEKEEAKEEKKEEEAVKEAAPVEAPLDAEAVAARATGEPVAETPAAESAAVVEPASEVAKEDATRPKPNKRSSIFGSFFEKVRSPAHEKKESDVAPAVPAKDTIVSADPPVIPEPSSTTETTIEAPATTTATEPVTPAVVESAPKTEATSPKKEKESFFGMISSKVRAKSPANPERSAVKTEEAPAVPPKAEETAVTPAVEEPVSAAPAATESPAEVPATEASDKVADKATTPKESRRKSYFGSGQNIFRKASQAVRGNKEPKKENVAPAAEEKAVASEAPVVSEETPAVETTEPAAETKAEEPQAIGDVVPEAVTEGKSAPVVSAAA